MSKFKKNLHLAKQCRLEDIERQILNYPSRFPVPKYLVFIKTMIMNGWSVRLYVANKVSKYIFIKRGEAVYKIRFSNHKPLYEKEIENDCDFYVGMSHTQCSTTEEIMQKLLK